jgi:hypothetical protein
MNNFDAFVSFVAATLASVFYWIIDFLQMIIGMVGWNVVAVIVLIVVLIKLSSR